MSQIIPDEQAPRQACRIMKSESVVASVYNAQSLNFTWYGICNQCNSHRIMSETDKSCTSGYSGSGTEDGKWVNLQKYVQPCSDSTKFRTSNPNNGKKFQCQQDVKYTYLAIRFITLNNAIHRIYLFRQFSIDNIEHHEVQKYERRVTDIKIYLYEGNNWFQDICFRSRMFFVQMWHQFKYYFKLKSTNIIVKLIQLNICQNKKCFDGIKNMLWWIHWKTPEQGRDQLVKAAITPTMARFNEQPVIFGLISVALLNT